MPAYAGSPSNGARSATPLLPPFFSQRYSHRNSKSPYSFSVRSQPPPPPLHTMSPSSTAHTSFLPVGFQPSRLLPSKMLVNPSGGLAGLSSARAPATHTAIARNPNRNAVRMGRGSVEVGRSARHLTRRA